MLSPVKVFEFSSSRSKNGAKYYRIAQDKFEDSLWKSNVITSNLLIVALHKFFLVHAGINYLKYFMRAWDQWVRAYH